MPWWADEPLFATMFGMKTWYENVNNNKMLHVLHPKQNHHRHHHNILVRRSVVMTFLTILAQQQQQQ